MSDQQLDTIAGGPIPHRALQAAIAALHRTRLLPGQGDLLGAARPLTGASCVVTAPTGSGKSLLGDLAVLRAAALGGLGLWLAPSRALVAEHAARLDTPARVLGLPVRQWTSDHDDPEAGAPGIVVATYEKAARYLLAREPTRAPIAAVADEAHLLGDPERGPLVECLLLRLQGIGAQLLSLTACPTMARSIASWLRLPLVKGTIRPVPLREGVWSRESGRFRWRDRSSGASGESRWSLPDDSPRHSLLGAVARRFLGRGERTLLFAPTRRDAWRLAAELLPHAAPVEEPPANIPDPVLAARLAVLLQHGLAVHTRELDSPTRAVVEGRFRTGAVRMLIATSTVAEGVNVDADVVVQAPWLVGRTEEGRPLALTLTERQFRNAGGRAGRPNGSGKAGLSVLATPDDRSADVFYQRFLDPSAAAETLRSRPWSVDHALLAVPPLDAIREGALSALDSARWPCSSGDLGLLLQRCEQLGGLVRGEGSAWEWTALGRVARCHGVPLDALSRWASVLRSSTDETPSTKSLAMLLAMTVDTARIVAERRPSWGVGARHHLASQLRDEASLGRTLASAVSTGEIVPMGSVQLLDFLLEHGSDSQGAVRLGIPAGAWNDLVHEVCRNLKALAELADTLGRGAMATRSSALAGRFAYQSPRHDNVVALTPRSLPGPSAPPPTRTTGPVLEIVRDSACVVYYHGKAFTLRPLPFALLAILAERPGEGVPYARLMARLYTNGRAEQQQLQYHRKGIERTLRGVVDGSLIEVRPGVGFALRLEPAEVLISGRASCLEEPPAGPVPLARVVA